MIYKPSNATPSSEEIDVNDNNVFKTQVNTSGEPVKAYKFFVYADDSKNVLYETSTLQLSEANWVKNKELLKFDITSLQLTSKGISNGNNYLWGVRTYNELPGSTNLPNTLVCDGYLVGSTKYIVWSKIAKTEEELLKQIVYDRYIEFEVDKSNLSLGAKPTDKEKLALKKLMADYKSNPTYRERQKITWVDKELGDDQNYVKIETEDPFTYNYPNGTSYKIYKTSDKHTVNSLFADPNSNVNVSDWIIVYKNVEDATKAFEAGDNPEVTKSSVVPALTAKKLTGYSSDTGEMRVNDAWAEAPKNGLVYRLFEYDSVAKTYKELFSSDLSEGAGKGAKYYAATVPTGTTYYKRVVKNDRTVTPAVVWKYWNTADVSGTAAGDFPDGLTAKATIVKYNNAYNSASVNFVLQSLRTDVDLTKVKCYDLSIPATNPNTTDYYYDKDLKLKAGTIPKLTAIDVKLISDSACEITYGGFTRYIKNSDVAGYALRYSLEIKETSSSPVTTYTFNVANTIGTNTSAKLTRIKIKTITTGNNYVTYYEDAACTDYDGTLEKNKVYVCEAVSSSNNYKVFVKSAASTSSKTYYKIRYVKGVNSGYPVPTDIEEQMLTENIKKTTVTKYVRNETGSGMVTSEATSISLVDEVSSYITLSGVEYNVRSPEAQTISGDDEFYTAYSIVNGYAKITINGVEYLVATKDLTKRGAGQPVNNQYDLQIVGGVPITNDLFISLNNEINYWTAPTPTPGLEIPKLVKLIFIQPNINIKTDTSAGVPDEIVLPTADGSSTMRIDIIKQTQEDPLDSSKTIDVTINKLDDTQWLITGDALLPSNSLETRLPQLINKTDYKIFTAAMDSAPLNLFYARTKPILTMKCRNTYVKTGEQPDAFEDLKSKSLYGILAYRLGTLKTFYSTVAKAGLDYYSSETMTPLTKVGTLSSNISAIPWKTLYAENLGVVTITSVIFKITIGTTEYYIAGPTGGEGTGNETSSVIEYPVVRTIKSDAVIGQQELASNLFASIIIAGVEQVMPYLQTVSGGLYQDKFDNIYIHGFTQEEATGNNVSYVMQSKMGFIYARAALKSESKLKFYFKPPVYNYRDMEFYTLISYTNNSEPVHPLVKYYRYTLYDNSGNEIKNSGDIYTTDINWEFKGLDEGDNNEGYSSNMNTYTVSLLVVDEYNREFTKTIEFAVYYPIDVLVVPLELSFDCNEQAIELTMENPLYALTTDLDDSDGLNYQTATYQDILEVPAKDTTRSYIQLNEGTKVLNYNNVFKDEQTMYPVVFTDDVYLTTLFRISSDFMWQLYLSGNDLYRESKVMRFGHKHPVETHYYSSKAENAQDPTINANTFMLKTVSDFEYDNVQDARGSYNVLYDASLGEWSVSRLSDIREDYIPDRLPGINSRRHMLDVYGLELELTNVTQSGSAVGNHGLHTRDIIKVTVNNAGLPGQTIVCADNNNEFLDTTTHAELSGEETVYVRNVRVKNFNADTFVLGVKDELGYSSIQNGLYALIHDGGNWTLYHYSADSSIRVMNGTGFSVNDLLCLNTRDYFVVNMTGVGTENEACTVVESNVLDGDCVLSYTTPQESIFTEDGYYVVKCTVATEGSTRTAYCNIYKCNMISSSYKKYYQSISRYGINIQYAQKGTTIETDAAVYNQDYLGITLHTDHSTVPSWKFSGLELLGQCTINDNLFESSMKLLFVTQDVYCYYIIVYNNGKWVFKKVEEDRTSQEISDYGITINTGGSGGSSDKDYIDIYLKTGEQLELRMVNPEYYSVGDGGVLRCNGYASCFRLYDVTDSIEGTLVPSCFYNNGDFIDYFSIPESTGSISSGNGTNYMLRTDLKLAIQPSGDAYVAVNSNEEYELLARQGLQENILYVMTTTITSITKYNLSELTPGIYSYNSTQTTEYISGKIEKNASALYAYIPDSTYLPLDERTGETIGVDQFAPDDTRRLSGNKYDFYYSDSNTSSNLWIDFALSLSLQDIADFDNLWVFLYLTIDNSLEYNSATSLNPRIKCGIKVKEGGIIYDGK